MDKTEYLNKMIADCEWNIEYHSNKLKEFKYQIDLYKKELNSLESE